MTKQPEPQDLALVQLHQTLEPLIPEAVELDWDAPTHHLKIRLYAPDDNDPRPISEQCAALYQALERLKLPDLEQVSVYCFGEGNDLPTWMDTKDFRLIARGYRSLKEVGGELYHAETLDEPPAAALLKRFSFVDGPAPDLAVAGQLAVYDWQYEQEKTVLEALKSRNIPRLKETFTLSNGDRYLVLEPPAGKPLSKIDLFPAEAVPELLAALLTLIEQLQTAHNPPLYSGQLSPDNLWVDLEGSPLGLSLVRFDQCQLGSGDRHQIDRLVFQDSIFIPPERRAGQPLNPSSDLYSAGLILLTLLTGIKADEYDQLVAADGTVLFHHRAFGDRHVRRSPLLPLLKKCVALHGGDRPVDAAAAQAELEAINLGKTAAFWQLDKLYLRSPLLNAKIGSCPIGGVITLALVSIFLVPSLYLGVALGWHSLKLSVALSEAIADLWPPNTIEVEF